MKLTFCVACGAIDDLQHHHLVTRAEKGSDDETNLITLCNGCHLNPAGKDPPAISMLTPLTAPAPHKIAEFSAAPSYRDGYRGQCKPCRAAYTSAFKAAGGYEGKSYKHYKRSAPSAETRARWRAREYNYRIGYKYGLAPEQHAEILAAQDGKCALCGRPPRKFKLVVDHCHETGRIRGLLCTFCNIALGILGDTPDRITHALKYVEGDGFATTVAELKAKAKEFSA